MTTFQNHHSARSTANSLLLTHCCRKRDNNVHADFNCYTELEDTVWRIQILCCMKGIGATRSDSLLKKVKNEQPAWVSILISNCEAELEEVYGHERERHQTSEGRIQLTTHHPSVRQLLNRSPLQTDEDVHIPRLCSPGLQT